MDSAELTQLDALLERVDDALENVECEMEDAIFFAAQEGIKMPVNRIRGGLAGLRTAIANIRDELSEEAKS
jgi:hypothetical protein